MRTLSTLIFVFLFIGFSNAQSNDPIDEAITAGVSKNTIDYLCKVAVSGGSKSLWGLPPMLEEILMEEEIFNYGKSQDKDALHQLIADKWEEKYSKVYCEINNAIYGSLDAIALYHENQRWVYSIYDPNGEFKADINRISYLNFDHKIKGTLLDYLDMITETHPTKKVTSNPNYKDVLIGFETMLRNEYGAKYMRELEQE